MGPNFCFSAADSIGPTTATRRMRLLVLLMPAFSCGLCHGLLTLVRCPVALESATFLALLALVVHFYSIVWVTLCWILSAGALVLLALFQLRLLFSFHVNTSVLDTLFPSVDVLVGFCGGSLFCSPLYTPRTFAWFLVLAATCFMVLLLPRAGLHAMLSEVQVSTQHVIAVMLVNVSRSPEVALDAMQRSVLISASRLGSAEHFYASIQCGYYHHGVPLPIQLLSFDISHTSPDTYSWRSKQASLHRFVPDPSE